MEIYLVEEVAPGERNRARYRVKSIWRREPRSILKWFRRSIFRRALQAEFCRALDAAQQDLPKGDIQLWSNEFLSDISMHAIPGWRLFGTDIVQRLRAEGHRIYIYTLSEQRIAQAKKRAEQFATGM